MNRNSISILIPFAGRIKSLSNLLESLEKVTIDSNIFILNIGEHDLSHLSSSRHNINVINHKSIISPSSARKLLLKQADTEFALFLDDDLLVGKNSIELMLDVMLKNSDIDLLGGAVLEDGEYREIGARFLLGQKEGFNIVEKINIGYDEIKDRGLDLVSVDLVTQPPFLLRRSNYMNENFDSRYPWAKEIYDFFFSSYWLNRRSYVVMNAIFEHRPAKYASTTNKTNKVENNQIGKDVFESKWGFKIVETQSKRLFKELYTIALRRYKKRRRVLSKMKNDQSRSG